MYYRFLSYLRFLVSATNQYGVHSPFVYEYVTKCLYKKTSIQRTKNMQVLDKSIRYFKTTNISTQENSLRTKAFINQFPDLKFDQVPFDLIYLVKPDQIFLENKNIHNGTIVLLDNIYQTKENTTIWKNIILSTQLSVTIDLYYCGVVFFRKEQAKEHFKIRI